MRSTPVRFGSVCSGIEAASVAWTTLGWEAAWFSEIEAFPSKVLAHHYPSVPNHGDMTTLPARLAAGDVEAPDILCGGTPCQAFSVGGRRESLDDARGNLSLTFCEIANAIDTQRRAAGKPPAIVFWENVPGALNTHDNFFGCFLGALAGEDEALEPAGGRWSNAGCVFGPERAVAWRVLDAQHFGVPQRRKRVILVACPLERAHPTQILFEFEGVRRDTAPSREPGQAVAAVPADGAGAGGFTGVHENLNGCVQPFELANCLTRRMHKGINTTVDEGHTPVLAFHENQRSEVSLSETMGSLKCGGGKPGQGYPAVLAFQSSQSGVRVGDVHATLDANNGSRRHNGVFEPQTFPANLSATQCVAEGALPSLTAKNPTGVSYEIGVRRLLPIECERLQGFPDHYTDIPGSSDTSRYMALGNSWPVPMIRWVGRRIQDALESREAAHG